MKTTTKPLFSCGTDGMEWMANNCGRCSKVIPYDVQIESLDQYKCTIQRDIDLQIVGEDVEIDIKSYEATRHWDCPHRQTERKP